MSVSKTYRNLSEHTRMRNFAYPFLRIGLIYHHIIAKMRKFKSDTSSSNFLTRLAIMVA